MTKKIIKRPLKSLPKKLREPITLEPMPMPPTTEVLALFPKFLDEYNKKSTAVALKNADHQAFKLLEKLCILSDHYGLHKDNPNRWLFLALNIARDYHPAFKIQVKADAGRKKDWTEELLLQLYIDVQEKLIQSKKDKRTIPLKTIFHQLSKEKQWKTHTNSSKDAGGVLQDAYYKAKKSPSVAVYAGFIDTIDKGDYDSRAAIFGSLNHIRKIFPQNSV